MFCNKCGKEMKNGAKFCPSCGASGGAVAVSGAAVKPKSEKRNVFKVIIIVCAVIAIGLAGLIILAAAENNASSMARDVVLSLRTLKSVTFLYYGDHSEWPTKSQVNELNKYLDRDLNRMGIPSENVFIGDEFMDERGVKRQNIGLKLIGLSFQTADAYLPYVKKSLAKMAKNSGLLQDDRTLDPYTDGDVVYVNMY